jgi:integrase
MGERLHEGERRPKPTPGNIQSQFGFIGRRGELNQMVFFAAHRQPNQLRGTRPAFNPPIEAIIAISFLKGMAQSFRQVQTHFGSHGTVENARRLPDLHFHDLRHEAISRFFEMGLSVPEVALISGHRDPRMLFRYTHVARTTILKKLH